MVWWMWMVGGLVCWAVEAMTPSAFVWCFFGLAALGTGALEGMGLLPMLWQQSLVWLLLAVGSLVVFQRRLAAVWHSKQVRLSAHLHHVDGMVGAVVVVDADMKEGCGGQVGFRGTVWSAYNDTAAPLKAGQRCRIVRVEGLTLWLEPESTVR